MKKIDRCICGGNHDLLGELHHHLECLTPGDSMYDQPCIFSDNDIANTRKEIE